MTFKVVDRLAYITALYDHEDHISEPIESFKRSVVESYTASDVYFASAEYHKPGEDMDVVTTYRVHVDYIAQGEVV